MTIFSAVNLRKKSEKKKNEIYGIFSSLLFVLFIYLMFFSVLSVRLYWWSKSKNEKKSFFWYCTHLFLVVFCFAFDFAFFFLYIFICKNLQFIKNGQLLLCFNNFLGNGKPKKKGKLRTKDNWRTVISRFVNLGEEEALRMSSFFSTVFILVFFFKWRWKIKVGEESQLHWWRRVKHGDWEHHFGNFLFCLVIPFPFDREHRPT